MMEQNEAEDFEHLEEFNDDIGYEDYNEEIGCEENFETIDGLVENAYEKGFGEEQAESAFAEFVLDEVTTQTELAQPEYLDTVGSNLYEHRTDEYAAWEMAEGTKFEIPEGLGIGDRINEIDMEDALQRMFEKSNEDFANNENSYQMIKEVDDVPWRPFVPKRNKKYYGLGKSQKEVMRGNWVGYNTAPKSYQTRRRY